MLGKGRAEAIAPAHMAALADEMGCHPADLEAIAKVESSGFGWFRNGQIKILPEPHKFDDEIPKGKRAAARRQGLATTGYKATRASGHYKRMTNRPGPRYEFLKRMIAFDRRGAFRAISVGTYQIMGFNAELCGFKDAEAMFDAFVDSEVNQLRAFRNFLLKKGLRSAIKAGNFEKVELRYNGGGLHGAYARRMRTAARNLRRGKWKDYKPGSMQITATPAKNSPTKQTIEDVTVLSTGTEKTGAGLGAALSAVGVALATAWNNGAWVLVSAIGVALAVFIIWRVVKRK